MAITMQEIKATRDRYRLEHTSKPVLVPAWIDVRYEPLDAVPDISLKGISGGGPFMTFDYYVVGGPDDGKRIELVPWRAEWSICPQAKMYNGPQEEFDGCLGYPARPNIYRAPSEGLHISTVMYLRGILYSERDYLMNEEINRLYKVYDEEQSKVQKMV